MADRKIDGRALVAAPVTRRSVLRAGAAGLAVAFSSPSLALAPPQTLEEIGSSDRSLVQVAVDPGGRIFVNHSRWFGPLGMATAEVDHASGELRPYPDGRFSSGDPTLPAAQRAVSVQSVMLDPSGRSLWIVDSGNPQLSGIVSGGAKLVEVDLSTDRISRIIVLGSDIAPPGSYLADMRIDPRRNLAFLPDLALGAIAVVDLGTGRGRRVLEGHAATRAEDLTLSFAGKPWLYPDGSRPQTGCTSIAISPDGEALYFKALIGRTLYQASIKALIDPRINAASAVRPVTSVHPSDAIAFGPDGSLYLTAVDRQAITRWRPGDSRFETVIEDPRLAWPVGLTFDQQGNGYTAIGRIHEGDEPTDRYRLYRFPVPAS